MNLNIIQNSLKAISIIGYSLLCPFVANSQQRTYTEIKEIASTAFETMDKGLSANRLTDYPKLKMRSSDEYSLLKRPGGTQKEEAFYVFTHQNDSLPGFVIVSSDKRMNDILAYSSDSSFDFEEMPANVKYWLSCYVADYLNINENQPTSNRVANARASGVEPLLDGNQWGQNSPYNLQCPTYRGRLCATGCVATAMSQVMWYYQYPDCGIGKSNYVTRTHGIYVSRNFDEHPFEWSKMKSNYTEKYQNDEAAPIANLMACCGASVMMDYSIDGSGAFQYDLLRGLIRNFKYDSDAAYLIREYFSSVQWHTLLINELNEGHPVNYAGSSRTDGGHSFVIDGYQNPDTETGIPYYHLNWGWSGRCNGYYLLSGLSPHDGSVSYVTEGFFDGQEMLIGIKPDDHISSTERIMSSERIWTSASRIKPGGKMTLHVSGLVNFSYRAFEGELAVALYSDGSLVHVLGDKNISNLEFLKQTDEFEIDIDIPAGFKEGKYSVGLMAKSGDENFIVWTPSMPDITIAITQGESEEETNSLNVQLCTSELEVLEDNERDDIIQVRVYELYNYSNTVFDGTIGMLITNMSDLRNIVFGQTVTKNEFLPFELESEPFILSGKIPQDLPDGNYRLFVVSYPFGWETYDKLMLYSLIDKNEKPKTCYLPMVVNGETVNVAGKIFSRTSTEINEVTGNKKLNGEVLYTLQGIPVQSPERTGIYIRKGKKVFVK